MSFSERISSASKAQWLKMFMIAIGCVLFVLWSGYYVLLLLILLFFDIYITRYINWSGWKKAKNPVVRKILEWIDAIVFALVAVYFINTFFFQNYQIPSSSLEKSLLIGDFLCVSKVSYGARSPMTPFSFPLVQHTLPILNCKSYLEKPQLKYKRLAGFGHVKHGDIVVFNYPSGDTVALSHPNEDYYVLCKEYGHDNVNNHPEEFGKVVYRPVDRRENYVKRCVGLPGDVLQIKNDTLLINGKEQARPENVQYCYWIQTDGTPLTFKALQKIGINAEDFSRSGGIDLDNEFSVAPTNNNYRGAFIYFWNLYDVPDSLQATKIGFKTKNGSLGLAYLLPLTQKMIQTLKSKSFVLSIVKDKMDSQIYYPIDRFDKVHWSRSNYGPVWIPKRGEVIHFNKDVDMKVALYRRCIKNYEGNDFDYRDGKVYINGKQVDSYTFKLDYYWMMGDNRDNSADSRVWGFVPEDHIVGQPMFIWMSLDKDKGWFSGKIRWNRLFTSAHKH